MNLAQEEVKAMKARVRNRNWQAPAVRICCFLMLVLAEWVVLGTTLEAAESPLKTAPESGEYRLMPGDKLGVLVFDQKDFSGNFAINGAGEIMLPLAGTAKVGGLTLQEAQQLIEKRLSDGILVYPTVSVSIAEFRPIFVTGRVRRPGNYPFIAGMSVKAAIATAGGEGEQEERLSQAVGDAIMADERVRQLETDRLALLVRKARLENQRDEATSFNVPQLVGFGIDKVASASVYAAENETFINSVEVYHNQLKALQEQAPLIEAEIKAVNAQIEDVKERLDIVGKRLAEYEDYAERGFLRRTLVVEMQIQKSSIQAELARLAGDLARLQQSMGDLEIRKAEVTASYKRQVLAELQDTSQRLLGIDATLGTARQLRHFRAEKIGDFGAEEPKYAVRVTRTRPDDVTAFDATGDTKLEPGDVVEIKRIQNEYESSHSTDAALSPQNLRQEFVPVEQQPISAAYPSETAGALGACKPDVGNLADGQQAMAGPATDPADPFHSRHWAWKYPAFDLC